MNYSGVGDMGSRHTDEIDRTDEPFVAYLLEILADFQITIPEIGTVATDEPPIVIVTSNRTREIHDALKRRCYYHWIGYPDAERELAILNLKMPGAGERLSQEVVAFVQRLRDEAHRFAIGTHRAKRSKAVGATPLDEIAGVGPARKRALLAHFGSAKAVGRAGIEDLKAVEGVSEALAETVWAHFHPEG